MYTLFSRILYRPVWIYLVLLAGSTFTYDLKFVFFVFFLQHEALTCCRSCWQIWLPMAPPAPLDQLTQLRKGPDVTAPRELETAQEGGLWGDRRLGERPLVPAIYPSQREGTMELNVSAAAVREPGSRCLLLPPPPQLPPASPECGMRPLLILLEKFQFDRNSFWQEPVPSEHQFPTTCAIHVSKNLSLTRSHEVLPFLFLSVCACLVEEGCDSRMLLLLLFFPFFSLSVSSGACVGKCRRPAATLCLRPACNAPPVPASSHFVSISDVQQFSRRGLVCRWLSRRWAIHLWMRAKRDHESGKKVKSAMKCHVFVEHGSEHQLVVCWPTAFWSQKSEWVDWLEAIESKQGLQYPLFATKVCTTASLNVQHIQPWSSVHTHPPLYYVPRASKCT